MQVQEGKYHTTSVKLSIDIKKIEVETQKNHFEDALIINSGKTQFFYIKTNGELVLPVNIRGPSESGKLIYSTLKPIKK